MIQNTVTRHNSFMSQLACSLAFLILVGSSVAWSADGSISIRDSSGRLTGKLEADGDVRDSSGAKIGVIELSGQIRDRSGQSEGTFNSKGEIRDSSGRKLGSVDEDGRLRDASGRLKGRIDGSGRFRDASGRSRMSFKPYVPDARLRVAAYLWFFTDELTRK